MMKSSVLTIGVFLAVLLFNLSLAVRAEVGRDEHMYIAAGYLMAWEGLIPFRDYPFLHLPYQVVFEAALFRFTDYYFLASRFFSALCATGSAACVYLLSLRFSRGLIWDQRYAIACGGLLLLVGNPLFVFTSGLAWNQVPAGLFAMLSFTVFVWQSLKDAETRDGRLLASGVLLGLAIGTRVSYVTVLPAFVLGLFLLGGKLKLVLRRSLFFGLGLAIGLAPLLYFYLAAPQEFFYGTIQTHTLNTLFRIESNFDGPITLAERWSYFWSVVVAQPGNLVVLMGLGYFGLTSAVSSLRQKGHSSLVPVMLIGMVLFSLVGSFISSPSWYQYFYAPVPFAVLALVYGFAKWLQNAESTETAKWLALIFVTMVLVVSIYRFDDYKRVTFLLHPEAWRPLIIREAGEKVGELVGDGKVLTLTPSVPLEGGAQVYPQYINMFVYRIIHLTPQGEQQAMGLAPLTELDSVLKDDQPAGILVGMELTLEQPLIEYAQSLGYSPVAISDKLTLWLP